MNIKKILFLSLFLIIGLFLFMPNSVNATEELNKIEIEMTELEEGEIIPAYAKVTLSNDTSKLVYEDIELSWIIYDSKGNSNSLNITDNSSFKDDTKYGFDFKDDSWEEEIIKDYEMKGYTITEYPEWYVNGFLIENEHISIDKVFWINGVESQTVIVDTPIVGEPLPTTVKYIFKTPTETKEIVVNCYWLVYTNGETEVAGGVAEKGKEYIPAVRSTDNQNMEEYKLYTDKTDFRTKSYINGVLINLEEEMPTIKAQEKYEVTFDANGGIYSDGGTTLTFERWINDEYNYDSIIKPTKDGYTFKGFYTEKTGGTTLQLLMAEVGVDKDMTFYAQWEENVNEDTPSAGGEDKEEAQPDDDNSNTENTDTGNTTTDNTDTGNTNKDNTNTDNTNTNKSTGNNPQTGDNIMLFVTILGISIIGVMATTRIRKNN